ncbi:MAG: hypothetical protein E7552_05955 [Ruminococcaceae bacterium]|nr:hypothetical protein [Oscillospiraceae bacterium]
MSFLVGCNYWASYAGCNMWHHWDESVVRQDLSRLAADGMNCLRVFPVWSDFQPVVPIFGGGGVVREYRMADGSLPQNPWCLDEEMLHRFEVLCDAAAENGIQLIVGLLTGWMSGRLYVPAVLNGVNLRTDPRALLWEQRFVEGFVTRLKHHSAILAWDHGNECNCMWQTATRDEAAAWTAAITNAIRAADPARPVISGIHDLSLDSVWHIDDQAAYSDMLVTHPYPFWVRHADRHPMLSVKTLVHAAAQTAFYADLAGKPCLVEEIGTMGPMVCSDETAAAFLRINMWHAHIYDRPGFLWWTAFDQPFGEPPYEDFAAERELGLYTANGNPKAFMQEMTAMVARLKRMSRHTDRQVDAVCVLPRNVDSWKIAFAAYMLAVQAGVSIEFTDRIKPIPDANAYILPAVTGTDALPKRTYDDLKQRVRNGAKLYLSLCRGMLSEFEELTGLCVEDSGGAFTCRFEADGVAIEGYGERQLIYRGETGGLHRHCYGKGCVYTLDFSPEQHLFDHDPENSPYYHIYREVFREEITAYPVSCDDPAVGIVWHPASGCCHLINYSGREKTVADHTIPPFDAVEVPV